MHYHDGSDCNTISVPFMLRQLTLLPPILSLNPTAETLMIASGSFAAVGCAVELKRAWLSPGLKFAGWFHNLLAYDFFHIEHIYRLSVVFAVTSCLDGTV